MRMVKFVVPFLLAMFLVSAQGAEKAAHKLHGILAAAPAAGGVVGTVTVKGHAKEKGGEAPAPVVYNLVAEGDLAKKVTELNGKDVEITGSGEPASYKLETIVEHVKKPK